MGGGGVLPYMGYIGMCRCEGYNLIVLLRLFIDHLYSVLHDTKLISQNVLRDISAPSHHCLSNRVETRWRAQIKFLILFSATQLVEPR